MSEPIRFRYRVKLALAGVLVGLGAPIGAFLLRAQLLGSFSAAFRDEIPRHLFFYFYMTIGISLMFAVCGFLAGSVMDRMAARSERFRLLSEVDELTGLPNRRGFEAAYRREVARAGRNGMALGCLFLDVDDFKRFNDECGHAAGDEVLRAVGRALLRAARAGDFAARVGGDEFAVLLPDASLDAAGSIGERMREELARERFDVPGLKRWPTVSVGAASASDEPSLSTLVAAADAALLSGKRALHPSAEFPQARRAPPGQGA